MERIKLIVANNILEKIEETEKVVGYINSIEGEFLQIRTKECPYYIPIDTIPLRDQIYEIIKNHYEDKLKELNERLESL